MAALVQGYPQQSGTVTVLQTRPSSASGMLQTVPVHSSVPYVSGSSQRHGMHALPAAVTGPVVYRGGSGPVQPYAFTSTPSLNPTTQWQHTRQHRTSSSPAVPTVRTHDYLQPSGPRLRYPASMSMTNLPSTASMGLQAGPRYQDDSALPVPGTRRTATAPRPANEALSQPSLAPAAPIRVPPERYRRAGARTPDSAGLSSGQHQQTPTISANPQNVPDQKAGRVLRTSRSALTERPNSFAGPLSGSAVDDLGLPPSQPQDEIKRVRRRSMPALDAPGFSIRLTPHELQQPAESTRPKTADNENKIVKTDNHFAVDKPSNDGQAVSADGRSSGRSPSSANRNHIASDPTSHPTLSPSVPDQASARQDANRPVNVPPRSSSSDASNLKRIANPSPLSKPVTMEPEGESGQPADAADSATQEGAASPRFESPAVRQLTAINQKGGRAKSKTSRLRRAFSFGSAAEFRKVVHNDDAAENAQGKLHKERDPEDAYNEEQARIAQQQEAAGIGNSIYSGGRFFSGSTDNLSISSTASSASIMIRKMGRGMKKGTRSLVGLFRPKSIVGAPVAVDEAKLPESTQAAVSMVTVEAERERVNVNPDPRAQAGGGTGFPRLERNSIDAAKTPTPEPERLGSSGTDSSTARKSIAGGEKERAEVLAAVRKGILKNRSGSSSPSPRPSESRGAGLELSGGPAVTDSPSSSAPSTPNDESRGHKRAGTVTIGSEDYFVSALRLRQDSRSSPGTPQGTVKRNATFSPRIVFFETWPSQEYDRRGDIATCNRLTPMLAQQIKEELNSFKMEMEVHENSKIYTHFF